MGKKVTIGIPVYNEEKTIRKTLESVVNNLEYIETVILSDNDSTDKTSQICMEYSERYPQITYIKQKKMSGLDHTYWVINMAKTEYYMHIGGHDILPNNYVKNLLEVIEKNSRIVNVYTEIIDFKTGRKGAPCIVKNHHDFQSEDYLIRIASYLKNMQRNAMFYGISKTKLMQEAVKRCREKGLDIGGDDLIIIYLLSRGKSVWVDSEPIKVRLRFNDTISEQHNRYRKAGLRISHFYPYKAMEKEIVKIVTEKGLSQNDYRVKYIKSILKEKYGKYILIL